MITELDLVALLVDRPVPDGSPMRLRRGDVGTVVHIYGSGTRYEMEFMNRTGGPAKGDTIGVETLTADEVRAVDLGRVMLHYSDLENAA